MNDFNVKLNAVLKKYYGTEDVLKKTYDLPSDGEYDLIVVSPIWNPDDICLADEGNIECLKQRNTAASYLVHVEGKTIAWIRTGAAAGNVVDVCLALNGTKCEKILFLGGCTALKSDLNLGDLVVANKAITGTGSTRYLQDDMDEPTFLQERRTPPKGILWLSKAAFRAEAKINTRTIYSTDTLLGALLHRSEVEATGADVLDMESSAFNRCMILMERQGVGLLTVVGNASDGSAMTRITPEDNAELNHTIRETIPAIVREML
jgi:purine-nucleoside phosphorylase